MFSKFFGIEKDADSKIFRLLTDLRALNSSMRPPPAMHLPSLLQLIAQLLECRWLAHVDARSFFFQFAVGAGIRNFFAAIFKWGNTEKAVRALALFPLILQVTREAGYKIFHKMWTWDTPLTLSEEIQSELNRAWAIVVENKGLNRNDMQAAENRITIWSDASDKALGFVIELNGEDVCFGSGLFGLNERVLHIYVKELLSAMHATNAAASLLRNMPLTGSLDVDFMQDNKGVIGTFRRGHGRNPAIDGMVAQMYTTLHELGAKNSRMHYVPSAFQRADGLSRNSTEPGPKHDCTQWFEPQVPKRLIKGSGWESQPRDTERVKCVETIVS